MKKPPKIPSRSDESTIHGLRFIFGRNRQIHTRFIWLILVTIAIGGFSYCGYKITQKMFFKVDLLTNIKQVPSRQIPFPAVTVCSPLFTKDKTANISKVLMEPAQNFSSSLCLPFVVNAQKCSLKVNNLISSKCPGFEVEESIVKFIENSSIEVTKAIIACNWREQPVDCQKIFNQIITDLGSCYSFNMQGFGSVFNRGVISDEFKCYKRTKISKSFNITNPTHNVTHTDDEIEELWTPDDGFLILDDEVQPARAVRANEIEFSLLLDDSDAFNTCVGPKYSVILHKPNEMPTQFHKSYSLAYNQLRMMKIQAKSIRTDSELKIHKPKRRNCFFKGERPLKFFNAYTKAHCDLECLTNATLKLCQCVKFSMPRSDSTQVCDMDRVQCMYDAYKAWSLQTNDECNCYHPCNDVEYWIDYEDDRSDVDMERLGDNGIPKGMIVSTVNLKFEVNSVLEYEEFPATRVYNFFGELGGLLALFLGCSLLSIIELIQMILGLWYKAYKKFENLRNVAQAPTVVVDLRKSEKVFLQ